jgi:hypothetical protein
LTNGVLPAFTRMTVPPLVLAVVFWFAKAAPWLFSVTTGLTVALAVAMVGAATKLSAMAPPVAPGTLTAVLLEESVIVMTPVLVVAQSFAVLSSRVVASDTT